MSRKIIYPEHDKLKLIQEDSQKIGEFIEWLNENGYRICELDNHNDVYYPTMKRLPTGILEQYFNIDGKKLEQEKMEMLEEQRKLLVKSIGEDTSNPNPNSTMR